jgi:hypothetical protein
MSLFLLLSNLTALNFRPTLAAKISKVKSFFAVLRMPVRSGSLARAVLLDLVYQDSSIF